MIDKTNLRIETVNEYCIVNGKNQIVKDGFYSEEEAAEWLEEVYGVKHEPKPQTQITAEQKCIVDLVNFAMTVSDKLKKKDFSLFSPTSGIGGGMKIGLPPICRMSDELLSLHEDIINEAVRAKRNE